MPTINDSVQFLKGVGPAFAKKFEKLGILTIRDLLLCYPRKYIDYTQPYTVVSAPYDVECCVRATVLQKEPARRVKGGRVMNRVLAADDSGILALSWFNAPYAADKLEVGETYYFEGRIGGTLTRREISHPLVRTEAQVAACPFVAVYPGTDGLPAARHASCAHAALAFADELTDPLPPELLTRYRMPTKAAAVRGIHAPQSSEELAAARRRLMDILCNYAGYKRCVPILVFDAYKVRGGTREVEQYHNLYVVYTREAETADMYIERATHELAKEHRTRVVSSDGAEQIIVMGHGALRVSARAFEEEVRAVEKEIREFLEE